MHSYHTYYARGRHSPGSRISLKPTCSDLRTRYDRKRGLVLVNLSSSAQKKYDCQKGKTDCQEKTNNKKQYDCQEHKEKKGKRNTTSRRMPASSIIPLQLYILSCVCECVCICFYFVCVCVCARVCECVFHALLTSTTNRTHPRRIHALHTYIYCCRSRGAS